MRISRLQKRILESLQYGFIKTQGDIALRTDTSQSSISRSIAKLIAAGLVVKTSNGYSITHEGIEVVNPKEKKSGISRDLFQRPILPPSAMEEIRKEISKSSQSLVLGQMRYFLAVSPPPIQLQFSENFARIITESISADLEETTRPLVATFDKQMLNSFSEIAAIANQAIFARQDLVASIISAQKIFEHHDKFLKSWTTSLTKSMAATSEAYRNMSWLLTSSQILPDYWSNYLTQVREVSRSFSSYTDEVLRVLPRIQVAEFSRVRCQANLIVSAAFFEESTKPIAHTFGEEDIDVNDDHNRFPVDLRTEVEATGLSIGNMLGHLNSQFPDMWIGAWSTYKSSSPDKNRQSLHSMRELIRQILDTLAPKNQVQQELGLKDTREVTRRQQIKYAIQTDFSVEIDLVEHMASTLNDYYAVCSAGAHNTGIYKNDWNVQFYLNMGGQLILFLLQNARMFQSR